MKGGIRLKHHRLSAFLLCCVLVVAFMPGVIAAAGTIPGSDVTIFVGCEGMDTASFVELVDQIGLSKQTYTYTMFCTLGDGTAAMAVVTAQGYDLAAALKGLGLSEAAVKVGDKDITELLDSERFAPHDPLGTLKADKTLATAWDKHTEENRTRDVVPALLVTDAADITEVHFYHTTTEETAPAEGEEEPPAPSYTIGDEITPEDAELSPFHDRTPLVLFGMESATSTIDECVADDAGKILVTLPADAVTVDSENLGTVDSEIGKHSLTLKLTVTDSRLREAIGSLLTVISSDDTVLTVGAISTTDPTEENCVTVTIPYTVLTEGEASITVRFGGKELVGSETWKTVTPTPGDSPSPSPSDSPSPSPSDSPSPSPGDSPSPSPSPTPGSGSDSGSDSGDSETGTASGSDVEPRGTASGSDVPGYNYVTLVPAEGAQSTTGYQSYVAMIDDGVELQQDEDGNYFYLDDEGNHVVVDMGDVVITGEGVYLRAQSDYSMFPLRMGGEQTQAALDPDAEPGNTASEKQTSTDANGGGTDSAGAADGEMTLGQGWITGGAFMVLGMAGAGSCALDFRRNRR